MLKLRGFDVKLRADRCPQCYALLIPDKEARNYITDEWDGHTYKGSCKHFPRNLRVSIG